MKILAGTLLTIFINTSEAVTLLPKNTKEEKLDSKKDKTDKVSIRKSSVRRSKDSFGDAISKRNQIYDSQLSKKMDDFYSMPIVLENHHKIRTLDSFNGILNDSLIMTTNQSEVIVYSKETDGILAEAKFRCMGGIYLTRVKIYCDLLVTPNREYKVKVLIREKYDGASTLLPSKFYTGEEARFFKQSFASFFGQAVDASKTRVMTFNGEQDVVNAKNKIYNGLYSTAESAGDELNSEASKIQVAAVIDSGREVRIEFLEGINNE